MYYYIQHWTYFLQTADSLVGLPLCAAGVALLLAGWRIWRFAAVVSLALVGGCIGQMFAPETVDTNTIMLGSAALLALVGVFAPWHAATLLGGIIGGAIVSAFLGTLGIHGPMGWILVGLAFFGATAGAYANRQQVIAIITSVEGGVLVISGLSVLVTEWPFLHGFFKSMISHSSFMVVFLVLVPTVIGVLLQQADAARSCMKEAQT